MALTSGGTARRIGLALSGGGFRAAAFHLGVMRRLAALGILEHVDLFTCVSGGSIAGATVVKHWADPARLDAAPGQNRPPCPGRAAAKRGRAGGHPAGRLTPCSW